MHGRAGASVIQGGGGKTFWGEWLRKVEMEEWSRWMRMVTAPVVDWSMGWVSLRARRAGHDGGAFSPAGKWVWLKMMECGETALRNSGRAE